MYKKIGVKPILKRCDRRKQGIVASINSRYREKERKAKPKEMTNIARWQQVLATRTEWRKKKPNQKKRQTHQGWGLCRPTTQLMQKRQGPQLTRCKGCDLVEEGGKRPRFGIPPRPLLGICLAWKTSLPKMERKYVGTIWYTLEDKDKEN